MMRAGEHDSLTSREGPAIGRFESVLDAVEEAASALLDEAEVEAKRRIAEADARAEQIAAERAQELTSLTDGMLSHAQAVNARADDLLRALDDAMSELAQTAPPTTLPAAESEPLRSLREKLSQMERPPRTVSRPVAAEPLGEPSPPPGAAEEPGGQVSEGAMLLAAQLAVAGGSREQIEARLRNDFGIEDPGAILDRLDVGS